jgi:fused signal recognition particle receptor
LFDKLREAFSSLTKVISEKKLSEKDLDEALYNFQLTLLESDVAQEVVENMVASLKTQMTGLKVERSKDTGSLVHEKLRSTMIEIFTRAGTADVFRLIDEKKKRESRSRYFSSASTGPARPPAWQSSPTCSSRPATRWWSPRGTPTGRGR